MRRAPLSIRRNQAGASLVEVLLAIAVFGLIVVSATGAIIYGQQSTMLSGQRSRATHIATEGIEAVRSIRDGNFSSLTPGTYGLAVSGGKWTLVATPDVVDGLFTRTVIITSVNASTANVAVTVSWQQNSVRSGAIDISSRLTNWRIASATPLSDGLLIYGDTTTTPKYRTYTTSSNTFGAQTATVAGSSGNSFILRTSPTKNEAIAGYVTSTGVLQIMCFNGTTWTNEWSVTVGGTGATRPFDIAYETNSGKAMVLYSGNVTTTNELRYRTKLGSTSCGSSNWSSENNLNTLRTSGVVRWVKMAWDRRASSNLITAIWADNVRDLSTAVWSGSTWGNEPSAVTDANIGVVAGNQSDSEDFDVEYESLSGDVMFIWGTTVGANANGVRYRTCNGGTATCTWGAVTTPPTFVDDAINLDISANPNSDEMIFASLGSRQSDLQIGYWSGTAWTNNANVDTTSQIPVAGTKLVSTGWLISGSTTRSVVVYNDAAATNLGWYVCNLAVCTAQADFSPTPAFGNPQKYYDLQMNPLSKDQLMFTLSDLNNDLFAKRLVMTSTPAFTWTNADGGAALQLNLGQSIDSPFSFAYRRF